MESHEMIDTKFSDLQINDPPTDEDIDLIYQWLKGGKDNYLDKDLLAWIRKNHIPILAWADRRSRLTGMLTNE